MLKSLYISTATLPIGDVAAHLEVDPTEARDAARDLGLPAALTLAQAEQLAAEFDEDDEDDEDDEPDGDSADDEDEGEDLDDDDDDEEDDR
jgi:hypothetical protein